MVFVAVFVLVFVVAPGDVAALGSGNATVAVIKPVNEHATLEGCDGYHHGGANVQGLAHGHGQKSCVSLAHPSPPRAPGGRACYVHC